MKITPLDIRQKSFENKFRGYDKDEVQAFLNSLSHEWERVQDEYKEMKIRYEGIQKEVEKLRQVESSLYKTLKTAEDTGAHLVEQANKKADLLVKEAQMNANDTVNKAQEKAKFIVENAEKTAKTILEEMKDAIRSVETDFHRLDSIKESLLSELKNLANDTLEKVEKYKSQKKFDFDDQIKKAKSFARLNKDYSYYTFKTEEENITVTEDNSSEDIPEPIENQRLEEETKLNYPIESAGEENITLTNDPPLLPLEEVKEEPAQNTKEKKQKGSFFDELD
jgi:cell division initiation protein